MESTAALDLYYNSMLPDSENTEWGEGWTLAETPAGAPENQEFICRGVGWTIEETLSLPRPLNELVLFDSGVDPPAQRWPEISSK